MKVTITPTYTPASSWTDTKGVTHYNLSEVNTLAAGLKGDETLAYAALKAQMLAHLKERFAVQ